MDVDKETVYTFEGDGWPDTDKKLLRIFDAIQTRIDHKTSGGDLEGGGGGGGGEGGGEGGGK